LTIEEKQYIHWWRDWGGLYERTGEMTKKLGKSQKNRKKKEKEKKDKPGKR